MTEIKTLGFIGLGVMGGPMSGHLLAKGGLPLVVYDLNKEATTRLTSLGAEAADSVASLAMQADIVFVSLPSGEHLKAVCEGPGGLLENMRSGSTLVDLGTSSLRLTREIAVRFAAKGIDYADAPVARTRAAAEQGTLAIMVGATPEVFGRIEPLLRAFASDVTHCGEVGAGQIVKILNNMTVVGTVIALCEAAAIAEANGVKTSALFDTFSKGSADSFALRGHGIKHVALRHFPTNLFSTRYMLKDISYALEMADEAGIEAKEASLAAALLRQAADKGHGDEYWPVILELIERQH